jgi:Sensors of blue-light using FAD
MGNQPLVSVVYTSLVTEPLDRSQLVALRQRAIDLNAIDGITGVLLYDGRRFVQFIEGSDLAIDDLLRRLAEDPRHYHMQVEERVAAERRLFPQWGMMLSMAGADGLLFDAETLHAPFPEPQAKLRGLISLLAA